MTCVNVFLYRNHLHHHHYHGIDKQQQQQQKTRKTVDIIFDLFSLVGEVPTLYFLFPSPLKGLNENVIFLFWEFLGIPSYRYQPLRDRTICDGYMWDMSGGCMGLPACQPDIPRCRLHPYLTGDKIDGTNK